ncbi:MAG: helix-turn-helix domain-containing protein, partial [Pseudonocardiaceae bacterium]
MNSFRNGRRPCFVEEETAPAGAVGYRLARQRKLAGLTQQQLAARSHVSASLISQVERGVVPASPGFTAAVASGLGVEVEDLYAQPPGAGITDPRAGHSGVPALRTALDCADDPVLSEATSTPI